MLGVAVGLAGTAYARLPSPVAPFRRVGAGVSLSFRRRRRRRSAHQLVPLEVARVCLEARGTGAVIVIFQFRFPCVYVVVRVPLRVVMV